MSYDAYLAGLGRDELIAIIQKNRESKIESRGIESQSTISYWADETFGHAEPIRSAIRVNEEMAELLSIVIVEPPKEMAKTKGGFTLRKPSPKLAEEMADVLICLYRLADISGVNLQSEVDRKMAINRTRKWKLDGSGCGYHTSGDE